jgi:hypothetical protein
MSAMSEFWLKVINIHQTRGFWAAVSYVESQGWSRDEAIEQVQGALEIKNDRTGTPERETVAGIFDFGQLDDQAPNGQEPSYVAGQSQSPGR